MQRASTIY